MARAAGRLSLPRVADGPLAGPQERGLDRNEDWSEIEALLASPAPAPYRHRSQSRRLAVPLIVSTAAGSAAFAGLLVVALVDLPERCLQPDRCGAPAAPMATVSDAPASTLEAMAAKPAPAAPGRRVADADGSRPDAASSPVLQGRSASEHATQAQVAMPVEAAEPTRRGRSHRPRRVAQ